MECTVVRLLKDGDRIAGAFAYYRDRGRFVVFKAKAVVLATGGIGKAYKITSNSWEYTGDGHTLAYDAGAELQDMEFVQFHPTGMIWPPSVQGILVTEGVRGEGGILLNSKGEQFMYNDIPEPYRNQTAKDPEEGWRYCQGDRNANRPAELLTRDHVARCILREVRAGPGHPARRRLARHRLDQGEDRQRAGAHQAEAAQHVPPVQGAGRHRHHQGADGGRPDHALHHGRGAGGRREPDVARAGAVRLRRVRRRHQRGQPAGRQLAVRPAGLRQAGRRVRGQVRQGARRRPAQRRPGRGGGPLGPGPVRAARRHRGAVRRSSRTCRR